MNINFLKQSCLKNNQFIGHEIFFFEQITSTNDVAKELAQKKASQGTVVIADYQTQGRGKLRSKWFSSKGQCLLFSIIFYPHADQAKKLTLLGAKAVAETLKEFLPDCDVSIKLPNDVLVFGKKISGILVESQTSGKKWHYAILGIGLNVNNLDFPLELKNTATSLSLLKNSQKFSRTNIIVSILSKIDQNYR